MAYREASPFNFTSLSHKCNGDDQNINLKFLNKFFVQNYIDAANSVHTVVGSTLIDRPFFCKYSNKVEITIVFYNAMCIF